MGQKSRYTRFTFEGPFIKGYDAFNHIATFGLDLRWRCKTAESVRRDLHGSAVPGAILDLACGTGDMARAVALTAGRPVVGSDPSPTMLTLGNAKLAPLNGRISLVRAVARLPFPDRTFSAITCAFGVRNFVNLAADLRESYRLLQPGGWINVLEFFVPQNFLIKTVLKTYNALFFPFLGFLLTGRVRPYRYLFNSIFSFKTVPEFTRLLTETGFAQVRVRSFFFGMVHLVSGRKEN
jgi:demethylmenaquinone methyltransferase/2-methoxy-6-polyprenyl-1,4-benzoquinol methylase